MMPCEYPTRSTLYCVLIIRREFIYGESTSTFENTSAILRASTALSFTRFRKWAIRELEKISPADFDDLAISMPMENAFDIIWLSMECKVPSIIKRALYKMASSSSLCSTKGIPKSYRTLLFLARDRLIIEWYKYLKNCPFDSPCADSGGCLAASQGLSKQTYMERVIKSGICASFYDDPLSGLDTLCNNIGWVEGGFCKACVGKAKTYWRSEQKNIWAQLDDWFVLPDNESEHHVGNDASGVQGVEALG